jgi:hypothetical protein
LGGERREGDSYAGVRHNAALAIAKILLAAPGARPPPGCAAVLAACAGHAHHIVAGNARIALGVIAMRTRTGRLKSSL